ncbi:MAG: HAMP domain-containing protein [Desulfuromonadales bacterium]|nr:HAMP domain-containing protein [Desulfuromonadales bacterium]
MRSLFLKIFLYFLLIIVLVTASVVMLTYFRDQEFPPLAHQSFSRRAITEYGREAIRAYESAGIPAVDQYTERLLRESQIELILFDNQLQLLSQRTIHRRVQHMASRALRSGEVVLPMQGAHNGIAATVKGAGGNDYIVVITLPERPAPRDLFKVMTHGFLGAQLLLLLVITAVVCFVLARSLAAPISRLRHATHRFAAGDLATRIGDQIKVKNELGGLARDFDDMAAKIQTLISNQQQLLRDLSHELRSPLARLTVALELARQQSSNAAGEKALDRISLEAQRMNEMIGQLLGLTRMTSGINEQRFAPLDLQELLAKVVQDADFEAAARQCRVELESSGSAAINGSAELLAQALENVIRNAVKYTTEAGEVRVSLAPQGRFWEVKVSDQGHGVPTAALEKIFDPFYRVADARDRQSGGTGIGLAIAKSAIALHGGSIRAENQQQGGLLVTILIPMNI